MTGYKTVLFGVILALISIFSNADMTQFFAEHLPIVGSSVAGVVVVLRAITKTAIFQNDAPTA